MKVLEDKYRQREKLSTIPPDEKMKTFHTLSSLVFSISPVQGIFFTHFFMENFVEIGYNDTHICPDEESVRLAKENPGENFSPFTFIQVPQKISDILSAQRDTGNGVYAGVISKQETPKQLIKRLLEKH